jgi:hypothetical protein
MNLKMINISSLLIMIMFVLIVGCSVDHDISIETDESEKITELEPPLEEQQPDIEQEPDQEPKVIVNADVLRLRSGPSTDHDILDRLTLGTVLKVIGSDNEWLQIITPDGKEGWVHSDYVKPFEAGHLIDRIKNDKVLALLGKSKKEIAVTLGEPDIEDWWAGPFIFYEDASLLIGNNDAGITSQKSLMLRLDDDGNVVEISLSSLYDIKTGMTFTEAMNKLGQEIEIHDLEDYGEFGNYLMTYSLMGYTFSFYSFDSSDGPIDDIFVRK